METKTFLEKVLSSEGHYCVFAAKSADERKTQKFYDSIRFGKNRDMMFTTGWLRLKKLTHVRLTT